MFSRQLSFSLLSLSLAAAFPVAAQQAVSQTVTLDEVVAQTVLQHPEVRARYHDFQSSAEGQRFTRGSLGPQVDLQGWAGREWRSRVADGQDRDWNRSGYTLQLSQLLFDGFQVINTVRQEGFEALSRYFDLRSTTDTLAAEAVQSYLDVQRYREMIELARMNFNLHSETLQHLQERQRSGVGRGVDLEQANGRLALAQTNLMTESNNLNDVSQRYLRLTGNLPPQQMAVVPDVVNLLPQDPTSFADWLRRNPSLLSKQALVQASEFGVSAAKGRYSPTLELRAATGRDRNDNNSTSGRSVQSSNVQLMASMNLYRGGADMARVRQTQAQQYAAGDVRDYTCRNIQQELSITWNNIKRLRAQLPYLREHELATSKVRVAYQQQFQIGQRSLLDLLDTENELFDSRRALLNATYDLKAAEYRWLALTSQVLPTLGLEQPYNEAPDELGGLELSEDVIEQCATLVPDTANLAPVQVSYRENGQPPVLSTPATR